MRNGSLNPLEKAVIIVLASAALWAMIIAVAQGAQQGMAVLLTSLGLRP